MNKFLLTLIIVIAGGLFSSLYAQSLTVTGKIVDMNDEVMPGVNIVETGTTNGAISDINGNFKITVSSSKSVLVFSFIGCEDQEIAVGKQRNLNVKMLSLELIWKKLLWWGMVHRKRLLLWGQFLQLTLKNCRIQEQRT